jgi:hypothetical protein
MRLKARQPPIEVKTLGPNTRQPDFQHGEHSKQRLLVRRRNRRIVDFLRRGKLVTNRMQGRFPVLIRSGGGHNGRRKRMKTLVAASALLFPDLHAVAALARDNAAAAR